MRSFRNITSIITVIVLVTGTGWVWHTTKSHPHLFVSNINLGIYQPAHTLERALRLENKGSGELLIHDIKMCCGISLLGDFPKRIPAKSTQVIVLRIKTSSGPFPYEKSFALHTNDPRNPIMRVFVRGLPDLPFSAIHRS